MAVFFLELQREREMRAFLATSLSLVAMCGPVFAQGQPMPWGQLSDMISWEVFAQITASSGNPKAKKVEFETWASDQDIYTKNPAQWPAVDAPKQLQPSALGRVVVPPHPTPFVFLPGQCSGPGGLPPQGSAAKDSGFPATGCIGEEVRRNWASFQYIVSNGLDSKAGLVKAFASNFKVDLPADAVEFKGDWAPVADVVKWLNPKDSTIDAAKVRRSYYTSTVTTKGVETEVALLSFHVSTKQIKNWVWSDFEGQLNPGRCDEIGCRDKFGAVIADVPAKAEPYQFYGECQKSDAVKAMLDNAGIDPIWNNYCLKGSQVTFVQDGQATLLGNSVIEPLNADVPIKNSSCITCHGYASFNVTGRGNIAQIFAKPTGDLDPSKMQGFLGYDFLWAPAFPGMK
jgi:hypothetical protein